MLPNAHLLKSYQSLAYQHMTIMIVAVCFTSTPHPIWATGLVISIAAANWIIVWCSLSRYYVDTQGVRSRVGAALDVL
jgi:hypothetical protein